MATLNTQYYDPKNDSLYTDGDIESEILQRVIQRDSTLESDPNWAVYYHFSPFRHNILNWYSFKKDSAILEIGAGCGALTGLLVKHGKKVKSCELTMTRANILFQRYATAENLEVYVGNALDIEFQEKFDYVIMNGVLEYAMSILGDNSESAFVELLRYAKKQLKQDGVLLLAIENRFGLKYFSGAPEDHVGNCYAGINGYQNGETVRTFTKAELNALLDQVGFQNRKWFYPYPDYKFPVEIFTDSTVNKMKPNVDDVPYDMDRAEIFDRTDVQSSFMKEEIADRFANSFLLEISNAAYMDRSPDYVKISSNRKKEFQLYTSIDLEKQVVRKCALYRSGWNHIEKMRDRTQVISCLASVPTEYQNGELRYTYINQKSLRSRLEELAMSSQTEKVWTILEKLRNDFFNILPQELKTSRDFQVVFGREQIDYCKLHWWKNINIDLNGDNIFCNESTWQVIDNEWVFAFEIPAEYVLWRLLTQLRTKKIFETILADERILAFLNISQKEVQIFRKWETHFANYYVGIRDLSLLRKSTYSVDLNTAIEHERAIRTLRSQLFLTDKSEELTILSENAHWIDGKWCVCFSNEAIKNSAAIRWDPLEGSASSISQVCVNDEKLRIVPINAESGEPEYTFFTFDPQFKVEGDWSACEKIKITFSCKLIDWTYGYFKRETEINAAKSENTELRDRIGEIESEKAAVETKANILSTEQKQLKEDLNALAAERERLYSDIRAVTTAKEECEAREKALAEKNQEFLTNIQTLETEIERIRRTMRDHPWKSAAKTLLKKEI